jgi:uncharacterized membrane protein YdjX (TVP38/TMEM64 family)
MIKLDKKTILGLAAIGVIIAVLLYLLFPLGLIRYFTDQRFLVHFITEHRAYAAFIFIGLQALQVVAAPVPGEVSGFVGGMLFGTVTGVLYSTLGLTLGSWLAFVIARVAGRPFVERVVNPDTIKRYDYIMKHKGLFLAFLLFLIPGFPKDYLCYLLGLGHMGQRDFLMVSTSGRLLGTVLLTVEGSLFRNKRYVAFFTVLGISILLILLTMIYRETIERWIRSLRAAQHLKHRADRAKLKKKDNDD